MLRLKPFGLVKLLCLVWLCWSCAVSAISLGSPKLLSKSGEPLRVEIPIRVSPEEQSALASLEATLPAKSVYERLGISSKVLDFNAQSMVYRNKQEQLMVLVETVNPIPASDDPFVDLLVNVKWSAGSLTKTFTLLLGDAQKILVRPGQTLSEIAAQMAPQLDGATIDQTMMALFKANPDAFASGSINRLDAGAELNKPSQALLRSISPAEANQFVAESNAQWRAEQESKTSSTGGQSTPSKHVELAAKDRLKIGSSAEGNTEERRYTEELVAQEKVLEQTKARVAELEKNIADLQKLLNQSKEKSQEKKAVESTFGLGAFAPAILTLILMTFTGLLLWLLAKNARRSEMVHFTKPTPHAHPATFPRDHLSSTGNMPERAKALFAGIDLDLSRGKPVGNVLPATVSEAGPLSDTLRVKLNLARAYITIEDFSAAKKSLEEILQVSSSIDPTITIEAQGLLSELSHRHS